MFTNRRHSEKAIMSTVFGVLCTVSLTAVIFLSYSRSGDIPAGYGFTGIFATILSLAGLVLGVLAVREVDRFKLFGWLGILLNGISLGAVSGILYAASYLQQRKACRGWVENGRNNLMKHRREGLSWSRYREKTENYYRSGTGWSWSGSGRSAGSLWGNRRWMNILESWRLFR